MKIRSKCEWYQHGEKPTKFFLEKSFLDSIALPNLTSQSFDICESEITEKDQITALKVCPTVNPLGTMV